MRSFLFFLSLCFLCSCQPNKEVQLPEITASDIHQVLDVSPAYIFYDETLKDSVELNRKNLISTTNWLVNVDKRLSLKQVMPHIIFLQEKKRNAQMHKNENAKNYYTCNDTSIKNLGFIEFTNVVYHTSASAAYISQLEHPDIAITVDFKKNGDLIIKHYEVDSTSLKTTKDKLVLDLKRFDVPESTIYLDFHENLLFQDYITYKSLLINTDLKHTKISDQEFLYN